jgi:hypothetical protein
MGEENNDAGKDAGGGKDEFKAPVSQEEFDRMVGARLERERAKFADYDDIKTKAAEFDKAQEASKTELQKAADRAARAEKERDDLKVASLRASVALDKGLTASQAKRLVGATKEELEADADELLADLGSTKGGQKPAPKTLRSGSSGSSEQMTGKEKAAAALRQLRTGT